MSDVKDKVRAYIAEELNWEGASEELTDDYPLLDKGVVDSAGVFQVVSFVETEFGVEIQDEELVPEHFGTLEGITRLVESKLGS
jgi:acyl carrier protein